MRKAARSMLVALVVGVFVLVGISAVMLASATDVAADCSNTNCTHLCACEINGCVLVGCRNHGTGPCMYACDPLP